MAAIRVQHTLALLERDTARITRTARSDMARVVKDNAISGSKLARANARKQHTMNSRYDIHYPRSITAERETPLSWFYGPRADAPQGGMSFEHGSRNQPPHLDLARSADVQAPKFAQDVADLPDKWFW